MNYYHIPLVQNIWVNKLYFYLQGHFEMDFNSVGLNHLYEMQKKWQDMPDSAIEHKLPLKSNRMCFYESLPNQIDHSLEYLIPLSQPTLNTIFRSNDDFQNNSSFKTAMQEEILHAISIFKKYQK